MHYFEETTILQAGVLPYRIKNGRPEVMLITAGDKWIIPKGHLEPFLSAPDSAAKEAYEEAGISGAVSPDPLGYWVYTKKGLEFRVDIYPLLVQEVHSTWPDHKRRKRKWFSLTKALSRVSGKELQQILLKVEGFVRLKAKV